MNCVQWLSNFSKIGNALVRLGSFQPHFAVLLLILAFCGEVPVGSWLFSSHFCFFVSSVCSSPFFLQRPTLAKRIARNGFLTRGTVLGGDIYSPLGRGEQCSSFIYKAGPFYLTKASNSNRAFSISAFVGWGRRKGKGEREREKQKRGGEKLSACSVTTNGF